MTVLRWHCLLIAKNFGFFSQVSTVCGLSFTLVSLKKFFYNAVPSVKGNGQSSLSRMSLKKRSKTSQLAEFILT